MQPRPWVAIAWLVGGLVVIEGCSNGPSEAPPMASPTKPAAPQEASPDEAAPDAAPPAPVSRRPGEGERLNPELAGLGTEPLLAAFPERVGGWTRSAINPHPAGSAGRWADGASATYRQDAREIRVDVTDMIRVNACKPGTGSAIVTESLAASRESKGVALGKHPAVLAPTSPGAEIGLWLGDRCQLGLSTTDATGAELVALGSGLGLDALAAACARREPVGPLGP